MVVVDMLDIAVRKNSGSHIDASHSRQPLVKGERLVRYEVNAVMPIGGNLGLHECSTEVFNDEMAWAHTHSE
jgi:hypothetical protein